MAVSVFFSRWDILVPVPGMNPVTESELEMAVHEKIVLATSDLSLILVGKPEQMVVSRLVFARLGFG